MSPLFFIALELNGSFPLSLSLYVKKKRKQKKLSEH